MRGTVFLQNVSFSFHNDLSSSNNQHYSDSDSSDSSYFLSEEKKEYEEEEEEEKSQIEEEDINTTDADGLFSLETVACLGCCSLAPVMSINGRVYGKLDRKNTVKILKEYAAK